MDIQENSNSLSMVVSHKSIEILFGCFTLLFGLTGLSVGLPVLLSFGLSTLECQRIEQNQAVCKLNARNLSGQLQGAEVGFEQEGGSRVVILTTKGKFPLTKYYSQGIGENPEQTVKRINDFVGYPDQAVLNVKQDWRLFGYVFGGTFTLLGLGSTFIAVLLIAGDSKTIWLFDKTSGQLQIIAQSRFIKPQVKQEWSLDEITQVQIVEKRSSDGALMHSLSVKSKSGELVQLPVNPYYRKDYDELKKKINEFLNLRIS